MQLLKVIRDHPKSFLFTALLGSLTLSTIYFNYSQNNITANSSTDNSVIEHDMGDLSLNTEVVLDPDEINFVDSVNDFSIDNQSDLIIDQNETIVSELGSVNSADETLNLISRGDGTFSLEGRKSRVVTAASVIVTDDQRAEITITLDGDHSMRFGGHVMKRGDDFIEIELTNSGMADAEGILLVEKRGHEIELLEGKGLLDFQPFSLSFTHQNSISGEVELDDDFFTSDGGDANLEDSNYDFFLQQRGRGLFNVEGRKKEKVDSVMVQVNDEQSAIVSLRLKGGRMMTFRGNVKYRDAYSVAIEVDSLGMADAQGFINLDYGANNSINHLMGDGKLGDQHFLINFSR